MPRRGIASFGDIVQLANGTDPNAIWTEFAQTLQIQNNKRTALVELLTFRTTDKSATVLQTPDATAEFEDASEYGVPTALRAEAATIELGYPLKWKDLGTRYTWRFLADATAQQVESLHAAALAADNKLQLRTVLGALLHDANRTHASTDATIHALWNGDGAAIPDYNGDTFGPTHNHYMTTESTVVAPGDVEQLTDQVLHHGYGENDGAQLVVLCNREQADRIAGWRAGVNGAAFDFISSDTAVPYLSTEQLVGSRPSGNVGGMQITGQYGRALIAPTSLMPVGYMACVAVGGPTPVIGLREHPRNTGLQVIPGSRPGYPLVESYYTHAVGAGVRQRGAAAVMQVTTSEVYTPPAGLLL